MDLNQKLHIKLAPLTLDGVTNHSKQKPKDRNRLKGGSTTLMYACQQGLTDTIVKEIRWQVIIKTKSLNQRNFHFF